MTKTEHMLGAKHSQEELEEVHFLYKYFNIKPLPKSSALRKLHHETFLLVTEQQDQSKSSRTNEQVQMLEGWDCPCRFPFWRYHAPTKEWHRKVLCSNPISRETWKTNELDPEVCKRCNDTGGSANLPSLPEPKKTEKPQPTSKPQTVQKQRKCIDCGSDISHLEDFKRRCLSCYLRFRNPAWQGEGKPLAGSPMALRMKEAEAIRIANAKLIKQSKEE